MCLTLALSVIYLYFGGAFAFFTNQTCGSKIYDPSDDDPFQQLAWQCENCFMKSFRDNFVKVEVLQTKELQLPALVEELYFNCGRSGGTHVNSYYSCKSVLEIQATLQVL